MALTVHEFWQLVVASGLHDEESCRRLADGFAKARDAGEIAKTTSLPEWMLAAGAMTRYQAQVLLAGKPGPFVYGDYLVSDCLELAGTPGMFRAVHRPTTVNVALCFLSGAALVDPAVVNALVAQTAASAALTRPSQYLTHCHTLVDLGTYRFFVIDELPASTLAERLTRGAAVGIKEAARVILQVTRGLACLHATCQAHGAIRPDHIWLALDGAARLATFPLARDPLAAIGLHVASDVEVAAADYCPPECATGALPRPAGDMYSLGCMLYQMLSGRVPLPGESLKHRLSLHRSVTPQPLDEVNPAVPKGLATLVGRLLAKEPGARFADAAQLAAVLEPLAKKLGAMPDSQTALAPRVKLDSWLAAHGGLPDATAVAAAVPLVIAPAGDLGAPAGTSLRQVRSRRKKTPMIAGGVMALLVASVAIFMLSTGWETAPGVHAVATGLPRDKPPAALPEVAHDRPSPGNSEVEAGGHATADESAPEPAQEEAIVGLDAPMWASPTHGAPLDLKYLAPGADVIVALRPADLWRHIEAEKIFDPRTTGFLGTFVTEDLVTILATPLSGIESVILGLFDSDDGGPRWALVARLSDAANEEALLTAWGNPEPKEKEGVSYFQNPDRAFYLPASDGGRTIVLGPTELIVDEVIPAGGAPPPLSREMDSLLAASDADRDLTALAAPSVLSTGGRGWLPGNTSRLRAPLEWFLSGSEFDTATAAHSGQTAAPASRELRSIDLSSQGMPKAVLASVHLTANDLFAELRIPGEPNRPTAVAARAYRERVSRLPKLVRDYIRSVALSDYSRDILFDFPLMVDQLVRYTVVGTAGRQVVVRAYLPSVATHNFALATHLALVQQPRSAGESPVRPSQTQPVAEPLARRLDRKITLTFDRATLEKSLEMLGEEIDAQVVILGSDLQTEGITKNQSFGLDERELPAREILQKIMIRANPDGKLVYVIKPPPGASGEALTITTRAAAKRRGDTLPAELTEQP
jgi:hypothetical protein